MRLYDPADEEKIRLQRLVRAWASAGLLAEGQAQRLAAELHVGLRRTHGVLRAGLAVFTALVLVAAVLLAGVLLDLYRDVATGILCTLAGAACFTAADRLVVRLRFYRHGVEETCAVVSCMFFAAGAALLTDNRYGWYSSAGLVAALVVGAAAAYVTYRRFGFQYAVVASIGCLAAIPFQFSIGVPAQRLLSAAVFGCGFVAARVAGRRVDDERVAEDAAVVAAAAFAGAYLAVNLYATHAVIGTVSPPLAATWFRWTTYAAIWVLPIAGLWIGILDRERWLLDVGAAAMLVTLVSNKPYLSLVQRPWDPVVLGSVLIAVALVVRRWLAAGPHGERSGFTSQRILAGEPDLVRVAALASAAIDVRPSMPSRPPSLFQGGRSGGGGAAGEF